MNKSTLLTATVSAATAILILAATATYAESRTAPVATPNGDAEQTFATFKGLAGEWKGTTANGAPVTVSYEVLAGGTAVLERFVHSGHGEAKAMLTVYHLDGDDLMLTHYCMTGNQPRMRAAEFGGKEVRFEFVDVTNLAAPGAGHMHEAAFEFKAEDRFATAWTFREDGSDAFTEWVDVERVK